MLELRNYDLRVRNIHTEMEFDPALPETMVDTNQLQQVFFNIINNAEQAMKGDDEGTLRIRTRPSGRTITVSFADSGPGMSADTVRRIFDPFFTTKEAGEGTGLGLTICYNIIEEHNGRIWAESEPGRGTTFFIELPIVEGVAQLARTHDAEPPPVAAGEHRRILVVDDEDSIQKLLTGVLEMDGHDVIVAKNGREALDIASARRHRPDHHGHEDAGDGRRRAVHQPPRRKQPAGIARHLHHRRHRRARHAPFPAGRREHRAGEAVPAAGRARSRVGSAGALGRQHSQHRQ